MYIYILICSMVGVVWSCLILFYEIFDTCGIRNLKIIVYGKETIKTSPNRVQDIISKLKKIICSQAVEIV